LFHDPARDRKAESGASRLAASGLVRAIEMVEYFTLIFMPDPDASITYDYYRLSVILFQL